MVIFPCPPLCTKKDKTWIYDKYYVGNRDQEGRKHGRGSNHWTGAKSIEWYTGQFLHNTMHGVGEYRWRHIGDDGMSYSYEGHFLCNKMHGYGVMSYPDGRVFTGLYHNNIRWGPGIERHVCLRENVGLWRGKQLIRLAWKPATPSIAPDFHSSDMGKSCMNPHRTILAERHRELGETNSAIELLKHYGADPRLATEKWNKLYPKLCTDLASPLCYKEVFEHDYYKGRKKLLEEVQDTIQSNHENKSDMSTYYAWNNNSVTVHMMKHTYTHDEQRDPADIDVEKVLSGPRIFFKAAGKHELDCRSLMMSSYLGQSADVVKLVKDNNVHPDISDSLGNSALMYATSGDQVDIIHFLVEAGANVNCCNDSCLTPLGIALLRFACVIKDIAPKDITQAILAHANAPASLEKKFFEWNFTRDQTELLTSTPSKMFKPVPGAKKTKSSQSFKDSNISKKKTESSLPQLIVVEHTSDKSFTEDRDSYFRVNSEFETKINNEFLRLSGVNPIPFLFEVLDMVEDTNYSDEDLKRVRDKSNKQVLYKHSKISKETMKRSKEMMWQNTNKAEFSSIDSIEKQRNEAITRTMMTILQLLRDGANPKLVKCPRPALFIAVISGSPDLVKHLVNHGADINEVYNESFGYTPLDLAVSRELSFGNLNLIRTILECGANTSYKLRYGNLSSSDTNIFDECGPTLLHVVLARNTYSDTEDEIKNQVLEVLLEYKCDPLIQCKGRSAIDLAMSKSMNLLDIFINSPTTNLNAPINNSNQSVLVKMFSMPFFTTVLHLERVQTLTNLLLFGADPLIKCRNGSDEYQNIFVFALKTLNELEAGQTRAPLPPAKVSSAPVTKKKALPTSVKKETTSTKPMGKLSVDAVDDFRQAIDLVTDCARLLHMRWLQAKLVKELVEIIDRNKHRYWNMILKEHKRKKATELWLTPHRCLEIWDILKLTKKKVYNDEKVLKHLLHIIQYYNSSTKSPTSQPTVDQKSSIECCISYLLKERKNTRVTANLHSWKRTYVKPELTSEGDEHKFNICFECGLPLNKERILCLSCKMVAFCSLCCMKLNVDRANCHPCSTYLKAKYFTSPPESDT